MSKSEKRKIIIGEPEFDEKNFFRLSCFLTKNKHNQEMVCIIHGAWLGLLVIMIAVLSFGLLASKYLFYDNISWFMALSPWIGFAALFVFVEVFKNKAIEKIREDEEKDQESV